ncbi:hypothetical protein [Reichenbachiella sp. MALMAid0571]|uniref:dipeptidyl-peptidase 3 family protein n=1 Tax=Reichenbachiella sp. MALMAid0571 TaxID=3143939 RepID=UPI0032DFC9E7
MKKIPLFAFTLLLIACQPKANKEGSLTKTSVENEELQQYLSQYEPYEMSFDATGYNDTDKAILKKLVEAAMYVDTIYWLQTSKYGMQLRDSLEKVKSDPYANDLLTLVKRNGGPFEHLNEYETFYGNEEYYGGDELYPKGMTIEAFDAYLETLSQEEKDEFMYPYTVIKEDGNGGYEAVRYSVEYKKYIDPIVILLNEAADLSENESFSKFLRLKAEALTTDNYFDADVAWIDTKDTKFDIVFGPFETYSDRIKGIKAKYEAYIEIVDQQASADLEIYKSYLQRMEENLPIPDEYKSVVEGLTANFIVVRDIIRTGEGAIGYQAVATNLPNDPEVHAKKGTKKTFWKNMFEARFNAIIKPVSMRLIDESQLQYLSDDGFFMFVLMHEICHAIGPRTVKVGPKKGMAANAAIGPNYSPLEEAKADVVGLYSLAYLMKEGVVDPKGARNYYVSFLGSLFRSIRFGLDEAHGKAAAISLNYLLANGGINYDETSNKWSIDFNNFEEGIKNLSADLMILEGDGDNEKVEAFFAKWTKETPQLTKAFETVEDIAIDVLPVRSIKWQ